MIRKLVKTTAALALHYSGSARLMSHSRNPLIIGYHDVVEDVSTEEEKGSMPSMLINTKTFERQIDNLARYYEFTSLDEISADPKQELHRNGRPLAVITFDDGYAGVYDHAFPLLKRKGIPFAAFVVTGVIGTNKRLLHDQLYWTLRHGYKLWRCPRSVIKSTLIDEGIPENVCGRVLRSIKSPMSATRALLMNLRHSEVATTIDILSEYAGASASSPVGMQLMTWEMVHDLHRNGVTIGSHTRTHAFLTNESDARIADELTGSRLELEKRLAKRVEHFAYPNGDFNSKISAAVKEAGYKYGYTICPCNDRHQANLTITRRVLWEKSGLDAFGHFSPAVLNCEIRGAFDLASPCDRVHI
jgi:peptidoglycan/xylan/chitin deacetylase (PgdA/CDA1 family)